MFGVLCDRSSKKSSVIIRGKVLSASGEVYGRTASEVAYIYARSAIIDVAQFADSRIDLIASWKYTHTKTAAARASTLASRLLALGGGAALYCRLQVDIGR